MTEQLTLNHPGGSDSKESSCKTGDPSSIPGSGRSTGEGNATHSGIIAWRIPCTVNSLVGHSP